MGDATSVLLNSFGNVTRMSREESEAYDEAYLRRAIKQSREAYFEYRFEPDMKELLNVNLLPPQSADKVALVTGWQYNSRGLIVSGPTGLGKTRACVALMRRLLVDEVRDIKIYHATEFFSKMKEFDRYGRDDVEPWLRELTWASGVFIDDYGQEALQVSKEDWARSWFFRFLDLMLGCKKPLIITTNLSARDMMEANTMTRGADFRAKMRAEPLLRRLLDLCEPVKFQ
jgi:DNA replication protein DnaC